MHNAGFKHDNKYIKYWTYFIEVIALSDGEEVQARDEEAEEGEDDIDRRKSAEQMLIADIQQNRNQHA